MAKKDVKQAVAQQVVEEPKPSAAGGIVWKVLSAGAALAATKVANTVATKGWSAVTGRPIPKRTNWDKGNAKDVVAYSAISAALLTGAKVAAERKAAEYYRQSSGHLPKAIAHPKLTKAEKKTQKKADKRLKQAAKAAERSAAQLRS